MKFYDENLQGFILQKHRKFVEKIELLRQMFSGLRYLHECCALIHRDLKPENLLVDTHTGQPNVCITDFGLSVFEKKKTKQQNSTCASFLEEVNRNFNNSLQQNRQGRRRHAAGDKLNEVGDLAKRNLLDVFLTPEEDCNKPVDVKEILEQRTRGKPGTKYYKAPEIENGPPYVY